MMQEVNEFITKAFYNELFGGQNQELSYNEQSFQDKYDRLSQILNPEDLGIPAEFINEFNMPMWNRAIKELKNFEKMTTPSTKLKSLVNSIVMINNNYSLFVKIKEDQAGADEMLTILPFIVLKAKMPKLIRHISYCKFFEFSEFLTGEKLYALSKLEIAVKIINEFKE